MDIADLRLLDAVAIDGSFSAAAARFRLSQPSVSARIAAVERAIGTALFIRDSRGARLTAAGARYLSYVRRSLALLDDGHRAAAAEPAEAAIRVGVPSSYAPALAPALTDAAAACRVTLSMRASHSRDLSTDVQDGRLDLALVTAGVVPRGLSSRHGLATDTVVIAAPDVSASSTDTRYAVHSWSEASEEVISHLLGRGVPRSMIAVVSPAAAAINLALYRQHIAIVPRATVDLERHAGLVQLLDVPVPTLTVALDWLYQSRSDAPQLRQFIDAAHIAGPGIHRTR